MAGAALHHILASTGEFVVVALCGRAGADSGDVGDVQVGEVGLAAHNWIWIVALLLRGGNLDRGTLHVHLTVTNAIEPSPGQNIAAGRDVWDGIGEGGTTDGAGVVASIACRIYRTTSLDTFNDHPLGGLGGGEVGSERYLARAATVGSAALKNELLLLTNGDDVVGTLGIVVSTGRFAWIVGAIGGKRAVGAAGLEERNRVVKSHVTESGGEEGREGNKSD